MFSCTDMYTNSFHCHLDATLYITYIYICCLLLDVDFRRIVENLFIDELYMFRQLKEFIKKVYKK